MFMRRGVLGVLLGAPVAAAQVASGATSQLSVGEVSMTEPPKPAEGYDLFRALDNYFDDRHWSHEIPPEIAAMKSWSNCFKQSEARRRAIKRRSLQRRIHEIWYSENIIDKVGKLRKAAEEMGIQEFPQ